MPDFTDITQEDDGTGARYVVEHQTSGVLKETYEPPGEPGVTRSRLHGTVNTADLADEAGLTEFLGALKMRDGETVRIIRDDSRTSA